jgi:hypothetical protein
MVVDKSLFHSLMARSAHPTGSMGQLPPAACLIFSAKLTLK